MDLGRGVVVLGAHRSGTSAVTGAIDALGLHACIESDRFPARRWNARGNFESATLSIFDDQLLKYLGGAWYAPPAPAPGWELDPELDDLRAAATQIFHAAHPAGHWVWKDPRASVLMPFWDRVLGPAMPRVVVLRHPIESAQSLLSRNQMPMEHGLALVERCLHAAFRNSAGRPAMVTMYDELLLDPAAWCRGMLAFVSSNGLPLAEEDGLSAVLAFLDDSLRHHRAGAAPVEDVMGADLGALWSWALERRGAHRVFSAERLPDESPGVQAILAAAVTEFRPRWTAG